MPEKSRNTATPEPIRHRMELGELLEPGRVVTNVKARSKKHALEILAELLASAIPDIAQAEIFESLIAREKLGCTALGRRVAIPHGRIAGIEQSVGAFIKLAEPVDYDAPDGEPVDLIFGLLVPEDSGDAHLDKLAGVTRLFSESRSRDTLREATSSRRLYELLVSETPRSQASA